MLAFGAPNAIPKFLRAIDSATKQVAVLAQQFKPKQKQHFPLSLQMVLANFNELTILMEQTDQSHFSCIGFPFFAQTHHVTFCLTVHTIFVSLLIAAELKKKEVAGRFWSLQGQFGASSKQLKMCWMFPCVIPMC